MPDVRHPGPISVDVDLGVGDLRSWRPTGPTRSSRCSRDAEARRRRGRRGTRVEFSGGRLVVATPKRWRRWTPFGGAGEWVDIRIESPDRLRRPGTR